MERKHQKDSKGSGNFFSLHFLKFILNKEKNSGPNHQLFPTNEHWGKVVVFVDLDISYQVMKTIVGTTPFTRGCCGNFIRNQEKFFGPTLHRSRVKRVFFGDLDNSYQRKQIIFKPSPPSGVEQNLGSL